MLFYVDLLVQTSGYEKHIYTFQEAESAADAEYAALCLETHNQALTREEWEDGHDWMDDIFHYSVESVTEVPAFLAEQLKGCSEWSFVMGKTYCLEA